MDVPSNIAGLGSLADLVFTRSFAYVKAVKHADKDVASFSAEIRDLPGILHNLHLLATQLEDEIYDSTIRVHHLHSCYETLEKVKTKLQKAFPETPQKSRTASSLAKLKWPFTSSETKELIADIQKHKTTLTLALAVDNLTSLLTALGRQTVIGDGLDGFWKDVRKWWDKEDRLVMDQSRRKVLEFFGKVNP